MNASRSLCSQSHETFFMELLSTLTGYSSHKGQVMQSFFVFFVAYLNNLLKKENWCDLQCPEIIIMVTEWFKPSGKCSWVIIWNLCRYHISLCHIVTPLWKKRSRIWHKIAWFDTKSPTQLDLPFNYRTPLPLSLLYSFLAFYLNNLFFRVHTEMIAKLCRHQNIFNIIIVKYEISFLWFYLWRSWCLDMPLVIWIYTAV